VSYYQKRKAYTDVEVGPSGRKKHEVRSNAGSKRKGSRDTETRPPKTRCDIGCTKKKVSRAKETKQRKTRCDKGCTKKKAASMQADKKLCKKADKGPQ